MEIFESIVIGAGQAGLSTSFHLKRLGLRHLVLDANAQPGGAWQHRWKSLTMDDVHGIAALPHQPVPTTVGEQPARDFVPAYFGDYEQLNALPVLRPMRVSRVDSEGDLLRVTAHQTSWLARTLVNATGTWDQPFLPHYPGIESFLGRQIHTVGYTSAAEFAAQRVLVVGGGQSAIQLLGEIAPMAAHTVWTTRRPVEWRTEPFDPSARSAAIALVEERVRQGLPPQSVVTVTGAVLRDQERAAEALGAYERRPMFERIEPTGVRWSDGSFEPIDVIIWATGFRPMISHLAPLQLRSPLGGIQLNRTTSVLDPRIQFVGYGPSASTIGANRAGRAAAIGVRNNLTLTMSTR